MSERELCLFLIHDPRQGSHDLGEGGGAVRGKLGDSSIFDSRFFDTSFIVIYHTCEREVCHSQRDAICVTNQDG